MRNQSIAKIVVADDLATFSKIWPNSYSTTSARCYVFQRRDILDIWCQTIGRARKLSPFFAAISDCDGTLLILLPLVVVQSQGLRILRFVDEGVSDFNAPVVFPEARNWNQSTVESLWRALKRQLPPFDLALFDKMPELVEDWPNPLSFLRTTTGQYGSYKTKLPTNWDRDVKQRLPDYADSRRRIRNLSKLGSVSFFVPQTSGDALEVLSALLELKSQKFIQTKGRDSFITEPGYRDYYVEATKQLFGAGPVHIAALKSEDKILAAHFGYLVGERFYALVTGFRNEPEWRHYAPGRLLNEFLLEHCSKRGVRIFDWGLGDEPHKARLADEHENLQEAVLPATLLGRGGALYRDAKHRLLSAGSGIQAVLGKDIAPKQWLGAAKFFSV